MALTKILVTGGAGHIGTNLINSLKETNEIIVFDNEFRGSFNNFSDKKIKFIRGDIAKLTDWEKIPKGIVFN